MAIADIVKIYDMEKERASSGNWQHKAGKDPEIADRLRVLRTVYNLLTDKGVNVASADISTLKITATDLQPEGAVNNEVVNGRLALTIKFIESLSLRENTGTKTMKEIYARLDAFNDDFDGVLQAFLQEASKGGEDSMPKPLHNEDGEDDEAQATDRAIKGSSRVGLGAGWFGFKGGCGVDMRLAGSFEAFLRDLANHCFKTLKELNAEVFAQRSAVPTLAGDL